MTLETACTAKSRDARIHCDLDALAQSPLYSSTVWNPNLGDGAAQNGQNFVSWLKATATDTPTEQPDVDTPHKDPLSR